MNGYWNRPELNAERARNGWHHTNDLGRFETDGTFTFVGPKARMLKSAAENIYPVEVENCIKTHPAVADCAVIGVPDDAWVQAVKAIVVLRDGATATAERDHRALPVAHRVVQEAAHGRVRRRAAARRASRSTTTQLDERSAAATTPAARPAASDDAPAIALPRKLRAVPA